MLAAKILYAVTKDLLDVYPDGFVAAQRFLRRNHSTREALVAADTDLVIEGFPRCANSFVCRTFEADKTRRLKIAHHVHHSSQVVKACRIGLPTLVLIREPREAIISIKALVIQGRGTSQADWDFPIFLYTRWYVHFYERIVPELHSLVLADFTQAIRDVAQIVKRVNARFGTNFQEFVHTKETARAIFEQNNYHLSPNRERELIKFKIAPEYDARSNHGWARRAHELYLRLTAAAAGDGVSL